MSKKNGKPMDVEKKLLIQKMLVGHFVEEIPEDFKKKVAYVWQGNGIWEVRKLPLGTFTSHIQKFEVPGLKSDLSEGWALSVPKIPATLLDITLSFFRQIYKEHSSEVFLQYFYDTEKEEYILHCPQQTVGPGSVSYRRDLDYEKGKILVFEIHSHGGMGAFFSGTDDADEKDDRFFGVIGHVKSYYPEMKLRLSVGGRRQEVEIDDIFNLDEGSYNTESFPAEWAHRIKEKKIKIVSRPVTTGFRQSRSGGVYYPVDDDIYPGDGGFPSHCRTSGAHRRGESFSRRRQNCFIDAEDDKQTSMFGDELDRITARNREAGLQSCMPDTDVEEIPCVSGLRGDQTLVEKNGKMYVVTDTGDEEIWEEIDMAEKEGVSDESNREGFEDFGETIDPEVLKHWRDIKW